jgi:branched-chain amino acid transport system substrate-binding protein
MIIDRRTLTLGALASAIGALGARTARAAGDSFRLGLLTVKTGPLAGVGRQIENGMTFFLNERGNTLAGHRVELITADTAGTPAIAKSKAEELIERDKVDVLIGPLASFEAVAIADTVEHSQTPLILCSAGADDLTQRKRSEWIVRAVATSSQLYHPLGEYASKRLKYKRVATIAQDTVFGYQAMGGFQRTFEENGGKVVQKLWTPVGGAGDLASYVSQIDDVDAVMTGLSGADSTAFFRLLKEYGLKEKIGVMAAMSSVDESLLTEMGDEALDVVSTGWYCPALPTPGNKALVEKFRAQYQSDPGFEATGAMMAGLLLENALASSGGNLGDKGALMAALRHAKVDNSPFGSFQLDDWGNAVLDVYVRKLQRSDGRMMNLVVDEYKNVTQFWTYDPTAYLARPPYGRA